MLACSTTFDRDRPLSDEERLSQLVDDIISLNAEGSATRGRLYELGWSNAFLDANIERATQLANKRFVRDVSEDPVKSLSQVEADMADIIKTMLPPKQVIVAELQARSYTKRQIDLLLRKATARAALSFAHGNTGLVS